MLARITIKELHSTTGDHVRRAGTSRSAVVITDRGLPVAVLANPSLLKPRRRKRTIVPGYETMMSRSEEHTSELQSLRHLVCRLLLEKKKKTQQITAEADEHNRRALALITLATT